MKIFELPDLGEGLHEAEIHEWHVKEGETVKVDQLLVSMETAKAVVDVPSPYNGKVSKLYGKPGDIISVGSPLVAYEGAEGTATKAAAEAKETAEVLTDSNVAVASKTAGVKTTPAVKALAAKLNVDLNQVSATGANGMITQEDVQKFADKGGSSAKPQGEALHSTRRAMAIVMAKAHAEVVPVTLCEDADIFRWPKGVDTTIRLIRAIVAACKTEPALNAHYNGAQISRQLFQEINLGIAVDTPSGLFVPVIKNVGQLDDQELRQKINEFKEKARSQGFSPQDLQNATITLSNFGTISGRYANPIIVPPTVAIVGVGKSRQTVVPFEGEIVIHPIMPICLTFDHRAATGGEAARFLGKLITSLEA